MSKFDCQTKEHEISDSNENQSYLFILIFSFLKAEFERNKFNSINFHLSFQLLFVNNSIDIMQIINGIHV